MSPSKADVIRAHANEAFFKPARAVQRRTVAIRASDVHNALGLQSRMPACALRWMLQSFAIDTVSP
jgi:hypothetical protein